MYAASSLRSFFASLTSVGGRLAAGTVLLLVMMTAATSESHATRTVRSLTGATEVFVQSEARAEWSATAPAKKVISAFRSSELAAELTSLLSTAERP